MSDPTFPATILPPDATYEVQDPVLHHIALGTAASSGQAFFDQLVCHIAGALHADIVFVTECTTPDRSHARTIAHWRDGQAAANFDYAVQPYPCNYVVQGQIYIQPAGLRVAFPNEIDGMESYIGVPLLSSKHHVLGHIVVLGRQPIANAPTGLSALRIFAARAAAELERTYAERELATSQAQLKASEMYYRQLFDNNPLPIFVYDVATYAIQAVNRAAVALYGFAEADILKMRFIDLVPTDYHQQFEQWVSDPIQTISPWDIFVHQRANGQQIIVQISRRYMLLDDRAVGISIVNDITAQKLVEAERDAAIEERTRLARDLHDAVSQTLWSASLLADTIPKLWEDDPTAAKHRLAQLGQLNHTALQEMRALLLQLQPDRIMTENLPNMLRQLVVLARLHSDIAIELQVSGQPPIVRPAVQMTYFRVAQEAINNVIKHAHASTVRIELAWLPESNQLLRLRVIDNGRGFDLASSPSGMGLKNMTARAKAIGACLAITTGPTQGTTVELAINEVMK